MQASSNEKVQQFLDDLMSSDSEKYRLLQSLRATVFECCPTVAERIIYGGIMFSVDREDFGGLFVYRKHISFEFGQGYQLNDPNNHLEGKGKFRRHLKLFIDSDRENKNVNFYVKQAVENISNT